MVTDSTILEADVDTGLLVFPRRMFVRQGMEDTGMTWLARAGGRKFAVAVLALTSATALVAFGKISSDSYQWVAVAVLGLYGAANVAQKVAAK